MAIDVFPYYSKEKWSSRDSQKPTGWPNTTGQWQRLWISFRRMGSRLVSSRNLHNETISSSICISQIHTWKFLKLFPPFFPIFNLEMLSKGWFIIQTKLTFKKSINTLRNEIYSLRKFLKTSKDPIF